MDNVLFCSVTSIANSDYICATCLSTNRRLFLVENLKITWFGFQFQKEAAVCWECKSLLSKVQAFIEQVHKAQQFLSSYGKTFAVPSCLSNLTVSHKDTFDKVYLESDVVKYESTAVKEEPLDGDDSEFDLGESTVTVMPIDIPPPASGAGRDAAASPDVSEDTAAWNRGVESPDAGSVESAAGNRRSVETAAGNRRSVNGGREEKGAGESPCHEIVYVSEEVMQQDRQKRLNSRRFIKSPYKCETCIIEFKILKTYEKHKRNKHSEYSRFRFPCAVCAQRFEAEPDARAHARSHRRYHRCRACALQHRSAAVVAAHYESRHEARRVYPCHVCPQQFLTRRKKKAHVQSAHGEAATCHLCSKTFCNPSSLKLHLNTHADKPRVECPVCFRQYKGEHTLSQHMRTHEPRPEPAEAYCAECDIRFKSRIVLNSHLRYSIRHVSEDSFKHQCNECGRRFAMKYKLEDHIEREHLKIYKYACERCGKKFLSGLQKRSHLNKTHHVNAAVVDKRATCNICGKEFSSASTCKKHQRVHTGERPYHCQLCPMQFSQGSTLRTHIRGKHKDHAGTV